MATNNAVDISENDILDIGKDILKILLIDRTTKRNIIWASSDYEMLGDSYNAKFPIRIDLISGVNSGVIQPRVTKNKDEQLSRTKGKAEVFTPSWICNVQNNLIDNEWFGKKNVFNKEEEKSWVTSKSVIVFPDDKNHTWKKYVDDKRLEITCGEAPYLVSRYDTVTGNPINVDSRIGLLDRKLRVVNENTEDVDEWFKWTKRAFESIYGFEFQGDSLLLARENLLFTFIDNFIYKFKSKPSYKQIKEIATVISWNIWQMDGLKFTVPYEDIFEQYYQLTLGEINIESNQPCYCKIKDWRSKEILTYKSMITKEGK
ncbi:putative uncharacterized protein [Eshraghiella crossota CAG:259]|uniref:Restriction endonuclease subunit M n=1 Tax=Eshraghiella crossota CAG:259 TaxID=1263062 RepID=R5LDZ0_9FIRM|nr:putative uncharacterized protein [Butyrivibrio crossotus CAG:259]